MTGMKKIYIYMYTVHIHTYIYMQIINNCIYIHYVLICFGVCLVAFVHAWLKHL